MVVVLLLAVTATMALGAGLVAVIARADAANVVFAVLAGLVLVAGSMAIVGRWIVRSWWPVRELIRGAGALADGRYSVRLATASAAPFRPVVDSFNDLARRLEEAESQRSRLLADLGHELRTPLTVIRGELEAMVDGIHRSDPAGLEGLLAEVDVLERLIEDLRTLSMAEAGVLRLHPEEVAVGRLVSEVTNMHRRSAETAGIGLRATVVGDDSAVVDPVRLREVVANVVLNALRSTPPDGSVEITVSGDDSSVLIEVSDTGVGIPESEVGLVFDRFHKGSSSEGSGLGLTISRDLVNAHGGTVELSSVEGEGTVVSIRMPRRLSDGPRRTTSSG